MSEPDSVVRELGRLRDATQGIVAPTHLAPAIDARLEAMFSADLAARARTRSISRRALAVGASVALLTVAIAFWAEVRVTSEISSAPDAGPAPVWIEP
ncbi:MAG: hypothetical protein U0271_15980 [Polyangiaceae bacterium]